MMDHPSIINSLIQIPKHAGIYWYLLKLSNKVNFNTFFLFSKGNYMKARPLFVFLNSYNVSIVTRTLNILFNIKVFL